MANTQPRPRPVLTVMAVLTALQVLVAGAAFTDVLGDKAAGFAVLAVAAIQAGMAFYLQGQVTPLASPQDKDGTPLVPSR